MSTADKALEKMRRNPRDWRIEDIIAIAERYGIEIRNSGGSHHTLSYPGVHEHISVPAHRPIKPAYIKQFVLFVDAVKEQRS